MFMLYGMCSPMTPSFISHALSLLFLSPLLSPPSSPPPLPSPPPPFPLSRLKFMMSMRYSGNIQQL